MEHSVEKTLLAMIHHDAGDPERIHHFLKVHNFARLIGLGEKLDERTQYLVETIAAVHDIGIHQAEKVYGSSAGKYQEELGPAEADSAKFRQAVMDTLDGNVPVYGILQVADSPFLEQIARRPDVQVVTVTEENRDELPQELLKSGW